MRRVIVALCVVVAGALFAVCTPAHEASSRGAGENDRFQFRGVSIAIEFVHDTRDERCYLSRYRGGFIEIGC